MDSVEGPPVPSPCRFSLACTCPLPSPPSLPYWPTFSSTCSVLLIYFLFSASWLEPPAAALKMNVCAPAGPPVTQPWGLLCLVHSGPPGTPLCHTRCTPRAALICFSGHCWLCSLPNTQVQTLSKILLFVLLLCICSPFVSLTTGCN